MSLAAYQEAAAKRVYVRRLPLAVAPGQKARLFLKDYEAVAGSASRRYGHAAVER